MGKIPIDQLTPEQRRLVSLFGSELGEQCLTDMEAQLCNPIGEDTHATYFNLGKQSVVQEIRALLNAVER